MSTRSAVTELSAALAVTRQHLAEVRRTTGDHPTEHETVVVDLVQDACDDLDGWLLSTVTAIDAASRAAMMRRTAHVADHLAEAAQTTERAVATYVTGLGGVESITRLRDLARAQGEAWQEWSWAVLDGLNPVWSHLLTVRADLDQCWSELVEQLLRHPVEVQTSPLSNGHHVNDVLTGGQ